MSYPITHLQRNMIGNNEQGERLRSRPRRTPHTSVWTVALLWAALAASFPSAVQSQLTMDTQTCIARLTASDRNNDGVVSSVEFANFVVRASPYAPACPDLSDIGDFLEGGKYYATLERVSCYCLAYDTDPNCCDKPAIHLVPPYPEAYLIQACDDINEVITDGCTPTASPTEPPTSSPVADIITRPTAPATTVPATTVPTKSPSIDTTDGSGLELPKFTEGGNDGLFDRPLPQWMIIALPIIGFAMIVCCVGCCLLAAEHSRKKQQERQLASKGMRMESDDDNDSMCGYPEVLEETDFDDTEHTMEEGQIKEETRAVVTDKRSENPKRSVSPAKSPKRMSQFLDSLDLEGTAGTKTASGLRPADSKPRVNDIVDAVVEEQRHTKGVASRHRAPGRADSKGRMGKFFQNSAPSSDASASSAEIFYDDQEDDASAGTGTAESNSQIKWKLLHPTTLMSTGAVEVFPLPPAVTNYVTSSSCSSNLDSGESKEEEYEDDEEGYEKEEEDSVSDVYASDVSTASTDNHSQSQPDPDGLRLEDGRHYREQWFAGR